MEGGCRPSRGGSKDEEQPKQFQVKGDLKRREQVKSKGTARPLAGCALQRVCQIEERCLQAEYNETLGTWSLHGKTSIFLFLSPYKNIRESTHDFIGNSLLSFNSNKRNRSCFKLLGYAYCWKRVCLELIYCCRSWDAFSLVRQRWWDDFHPEPKIRLPKFPFSRRWSKCWWPNHRFSWQLGTRFILTRLLLKKAFLHKLISTRG